MRIRYFILFLAIFLPGCRRQGPIDSGTPRPEPIKVRKFRFEPDAVLIITGGTNGMLEVCNCTGPMPGGLARRSGLIASYRKAFSNTILMDTGDVFWVEPGDVRNGFVLKGYRALNYDVVAMGDQEWAVSSELLGRWLKPGTTKYLSTVVRQKKAGLFVEKAIRSRKNQPPLAIVNNIGDEALIFFDLERQKQLVFDRREDLEDLVKKLKGEGRAVIVIVHGGDDNLRDDIRRLNGDLYIRAHTRKSKKEIFRVDGSPVVRVGSPDYAAIVAMKIDSSGTVTDLDYRLELIDDRWPLDRKMLEIYQAYAHSAMRQALDKKRTKGLVYVPSSDCGKCHKTQYRIWQRSRHANAWKSLEKVGRTIDPNCVMCHSLGFGREKGFITYQKTPKLAGVHCQHCHRFNVKEHKIKGFRPPRLTKAVCEACHTSVTDPRFNDKTKSRFSKMGCGKAK